MIHSKCYYWMQLVLFCSNCVTFIHYQIFYGFFLLIIPFIFIFKYLFYFKFHFCEISFNFILNINLILHYLYINKGLFTVFSFTLSFKINHYKYPKINHYKYPSCVFKKHMYICIVINCFKYIYHFQF